ncbi:MAG: DUF1801 domain-containing protein [Planctomycetes bacterium]|nr:DUF1801 domain-containing protein [Planctomycetota bacterium]
MAAGKSKKGGPSPPHTVEKVESKVNSDRFGAPGDWRPKILDEIRRLIREVAPDIIEERKWAKPTNPEGVPVWSQEGIVCTGEIYKAVVKLTFARGASLADPHRLFNSSLDGKTRRAIDIREGETLDAVAFQALIQAAIAENLKRANGS